MISVDRSSPKPVAEQLIDRLRYKLVSGQYRPGDVLPSTRLLARQVGVSFHSVRKAYQALEREGLLEARRGSGFIVKERKLPGKAERMERGATLVLDTLEQLIGLGLDSSEIEHLFQEQFDFIDAMTGGLKLIFAAACAEFADICAEQITFATQEPVEGVSLADVARHPDADYVITPFELLRQVMERAPQGDLVGVSTYLRPEALEHVARMMNHQTVGLITAHTETIQPLSAQLRTESGFSGQILATSVETGDTRLHEFVTQADLLLFTPQSRRRLLPVLARQHPHAVLAPVISRESIETIRALVTS